MYDHLLTARKQKHYGKDMINYIRFGQILTNPAILYKSNPYSSL